MACLVAVNRWKVATGLRGFVTDISQHPEIRGFLSAVHSAIAENIAPEVAQRIYRRIETKLGGEQEALNAAV